MPKPPKKDGKPKGKFVSPKWVPVIQVKPKRGAPTKYEDWMCDKVVEVAQDGGFHAAMMVACGIDNDTFYRYKREIPEFKDAVEYADLISLAIQEATLIAGSRGEIRNYNFASNAMILSNKYRALYKGNEGSSNTEININNNTINLSPQERDDKIAQILQKLKSAGSLPDVLAPKQIDIIPDADE
jgi:hypothetical protein